MYADLPAQCSSSERSTLSWRRSTFSSPVGALTIVTDELQRLRAVYFADQFDRAEAALQRQTARGEHILNEGTPGACAIELLRAYFEGENRLAEIPLAVGGSAFQRTVWAALLTIPAGRSASYASVARSIGAPGAVRAVGTANGANPIPIVVPCHRVIASDGTLGGYGGGLDRKRWLLDHEWKCSAPAEGRGQLFS